MTDYSIYVGEALKMFDMSKQKFNESQVLRMDYILYAKNSGQNLLVIKKALKGATRYKPKHLAGLGEFTSFNDFLKYFEENHGVKQSTAKDHVALAENWDIVVKLGMQDKNNLEGLSKSMRVNRTLKIIRWYKAKLESGTPEEELTLDLYWEEDDARGPASPSRPSYKELQIEVSYLRSRVAELEDLLALAEIRLDPRPVV